MTAIKTTKLTETQIWDDATKPTLQIQINKSTH